MELGTLAVTVEDAGANQSTIAFTRMVLSPHPSADKTAPDSVSEAYNMLPPRFQHQL